MTEQEEIRRLFKKGLALYQKGSFFDAHEEWETLWTDYYLPDRLFIQGLIQLSVSFVHLSNDNMIGAKSLLNKCKKKFNNFSGICRGINVDLLNQELLILSLAYQSLESNQSFNWNLVPKLRA